MEEKKPVPYSCDNEYGHILNAAGECIQCGTNPSEEEEELGGRFSDDIM